MLKSRRILALVVALVMTVGMLPTSAFAAEPGETEQGHVHTADCYAETLTCGLDEHTHGDDCYTISETPAQDEDNGGSEENSGSDDAGAAEPEPAPDAGSEDSGDQGGENESSDASSDSEGESGETSGSDSADSGDSAPAEEPSAPAESAPAEETNIADEPAPLAAAPAKELTCSLEEHTHGEGCYEQTLVCGLEEDEEAEAPEANGGAAATEEPSEAVQAFLETVAQLPETVDEENVEEVQSLMEACQDAYDALEPEDLEREDVQAALAKMASLMEQVETLVLLPKENAAKIGDQEYPFVSLAVKAAEEGDTIELLKDIDENITVSQSVTFDLGGHTWTGRNGSNLTVDMNNRNYPSSTVSVKNGQMVAAQGERIIEVKLMSNLQAYSPTADIIVSGVNFTTGRFTGNGGAIFVENGDLTVENCTFEGEGKNHIYIGPRSARVHPDDVLTIKDSEFSNASYAAVYAAVEGNIKERSMKVDISGSTFKDNVRGLYCNVDNSATNPPFDVDVTDCTFEGSTHSAIYAKTNSTTQNITLDLTNTKITNGSGYYGGLYADRTDVKMTGGEVSNVTNTGGYGIISNRNGSFEMDGTTVSNNSGYLVMDLEKTNLVSIKNAIISNNESTNTSDSRGAIYIDANANAKVDVSDSVFEGNTGRMGGALYIKGSGVTTNINGSAFKKNVAKNTGGAIYLNTANGTATIADTTITENTANQKVSKPAAYGYIGGGLYVANITGTVTLRGSTRVYNNHTPGDNKPVPGTNDGGSSDIVLASNTVTSSSQAKDPNGFTRATLVLEVETSFTSENGNKYTLTPFDRKLITANGWHYESKYAWPMGYYTVVEEPARVYLNAAEGKHTGESSVVTKTLAEAVQAAKDNGQDTVYVCGNVKLTMADENQLNESGIKFARCAECGEKGYMFTINGNVTLNGAHIDGMNVPSSSSMIDIPSTGHLTITGDTLIENGNNTAGNGGAIYVNQGKLTMNSGTIQKNYAKGSGQVGGGGAIYAYSGVDLVFEGGNIKANRTGQYGGGLLVGFGNVDIGVNGGRTIFEDNVARMGGGIYFINSSEKFHYKIYAGEFRNNEANTTNQNYEYYPGGGIYVSQGATLEMKNLYATNNTAGNSMPAISMCPTGNVALYEVDGALVVNNNSKTWWIGSPDFGFASHGNTKAYISENALGGGHITYVNSKGEALDSSVYQWTNKSFSIYSQVSDEAIQWAEEKAKTKGVVMTGNKASYNGSAIGCNGTLIIGTPTKSVQVVKDWADGDSVDHSKDQVLVYLTRDGKIVDAETRKDAFVILSEANNWSYTWSNLDPDHEWSFKEATINDYESTLGDEVRNEEFAVLRAELYTRTLTNTPNPGENANKLVIRKTAMGLDPDASYKFTLKLDNVGDQIFALQLDGTLYPIYNNEITFYLKDQQSAVVDGLPDGFTYEVTEEESSEYTAYVFESVTANEGGAGQIKTVDVVNMPTTRVEVTKTWEDDGNAQNTRPESITVNLLANGKKEGFAVITPDADGQWKHTFTGLPKFDAENNEIRYTVEEEPVDGYEATYEGSNITNRYQWGSLTIQKKVEGVATGEQMFKFVVTGPHDYRKEVTLKAGESETLEKLIPGTYHVEEIKDNANVPLYSVEVKGEGDVIVEKDKNSSTTITNAYTPLPGGLTIKKFVEGGPASAQDAEYTFIVTGPQYPDGTEVTVKAGESKTLSDLIPGVYTVREKGAEIDGYELTVEGEGNVEVPKNGSAEATIRNTYTGGSLTISKAVNGGTDYAQNEKVYTFKVTGPDNYSETVTLKGGESKKLENLKAGKYTVEEENASIDGHVWRVEGTGDVTVSAKENTDVAVTNHYVPTDGLSVSKTVTGNGGDRNREFTFVIELTDGDAALSGVFAVVAEAFVDGVEAPEIKELTFVDGKAEFKLRHGQRVTVQGIPSGVKYVVAETEANQDGYTTTVTGEQGAIVENGNAAAAFINDRTVRRPPDEPDDPDEPDEPDEPNTPDEPDEEIPDEETPLTPGPGPDTEVPTPDVPKTPEEVIELEDPEVPLADMPGEPEEPEVEIPDEDVPLADVPKTGDGSNAQLWLALALASLCGMALVGRKSDENAR